MSIQEIQKQEERLQREEVSNARAVQKRKCKAISTYVILDKEEDVLEEAAASYGKDYVKQNTKGDLGTSDDDTVECEEIGAPPLLLTANNHAVIPDNQLEMIQ